MYSHKYAHYYNRDKGRTYDFPRDTCSFCYLSSLRERVHHPLNPTSRTLFLSPWCPISKRVTPVIPLNTGWSLPPVLSPCCCLWGVLISLTCISFIVTLVSSFSSMDLPSSTALTFVFHGQIHTEVLLVPVAVLGLSFLTHTPERVSPFPRLIKLWWVVIASEPLRPDASSWYV